MCGCAVIATLLFVATFVALIAFIVTTYTAGPPVGDDVAYVRMRRVIYSDAGDHGGIGNSTRTANGTGSGGNPETHVEYENVSWEEFLHRRRIKMCVTGS